MGSGVKRLGLDPDQSVSSGAKPKRHWSPTSSLLVCLHGVPGHRHTGGMVTSIAQWNGVQSEQWAPCVSLHLVQKWRMHGRNILAG